jgi:hypothetical protein
MGIACLKNSVLFHVQVDICVEEMGNNIYPTVALPGDICMVVQQVCVSVVSSYFCCLVIVLFHGVRTN